MKTKKIKYSIKDWYNELFNLSESRVLLSIILGFSAGAFLISALGIGFGEEREHIFNLFDLFKSKPYYSTFVFSFSAIDHYIMLISGLIAGLFQFSFLHNKALATAIFSQPKKRVKIFNSKVLYPLIFLFSVIFIIEALVFYGNIKYNGVSESSVFYGFFISHTLLIIRYTLTGFVSGCVASILTGRLSEAIACGIGIIALPKAILCVINSASLAFLHGYSSSAVADNALITFIDPTRELFELYSDYYTGNITDNIPFDSIIHSVFWIFASIFGLILAKKYFVKKFHIEDIGVTAKNKTLFSAAVCSLSVIISTFIGEIALSIITGEINGTIVVGSLGYYPLSTPDFSQIYYPEILFFLTLIVSIIFSAIIYSALTLSVKNIKEMLTSAGVIALASLISMIIAVTGGLGYKNRIPDAAEIQKAEVMLPFNLIETSGDPMGFYQFVQDAPKRHEQLIILNKESDFEILNELHTLAASESESDSNDCIKISYKLKNGLTLVRNYNFISANTLKAATKLWDTQAVKENYKKYLFQNEATSYDTENDFYEYREMPQYVYLHSKDGKATELVNTPEAFVEGTVSSKDMLTLKTAIYNDIMSLTSEEWFSPQKTYGYISFKQERYAEEYRNAYVGVYLHNQIGFQLTSDMKNTIKLLKEWGYFEAFENKAEVNKMYLCDIKEIVEWNDAQLDAIGSPEGIVSFENPFLLLHSNLFVSENTLTFHTLNEIDFSMTGLNPPVTEITDKNEHQELLKRAHFKTLIPDEGAKMLIVTYGEDEDGHLSYDYCESLVIVD